jgi:hypothetical protein
MTACPFRPVDRDVYNAFANLVQAAHAEKFIV